MNEQQRPKRSDVIRLAGIVLCDQRTAEKALTYGLKSIRSRVMRERILEALKQLGIEQEET